MSDTVVRPITAAETRFLRQRVLRPHQKAEELVFGGDDDPASFHVGAFDERQLVGVASIVTEPLEGEPGWRVRGMATLPELRGKGVGSALLEACLAHARKQGGTLAWCHARSSAVGFYERHGFAKRGEEFELPAIGPHFIMLRRW